MKKCVFFMVPMALIAICLMTGCNNSQKGKDVVTTNEATLQDMVNIDEITEIESIIADSTLENADGELSWKKVGSGMIRIKKGEKFYLRMEIKDGSVTSMTYRYDN